MARIKVIKTIHKIKLPQARFAGFFDAKPQTVWREFYRPCKFKSSIHGPFLTELRCIPRQKCLDVSLNFFHFQSALEVLISYISLKTDICIPKVSRENFDKSKIIPSGNKSRYTKILYLKIYARIRQSTFLKTFFHYVVLWHIADHNKIDSGQSRHQFPHLDKRIVFSMQSSRSSLLYANSKISLAFVYYKVSFRYLIHSTTQPYSYSK